MSEPQTEYETDVGPTPLPCPFCGSENLKDSVSHIDLTYLCAIRCRNCKTRAPTGEHMHQKHPLAKQQAYRSAVENWNRIAAAGTAAQEAREMGYDPVAAVEALPKGLQAARKAIIDLQEAHTSGPPEDSAEAAAQAASHRLKVFMAEAGADEAMIPGDASVALASAEGNEE